MPMILHRPLALQDFDHIGDSIAQDNHQTADHFIDTIEETCLLLAKFPHIGTSCDTLFPGLRFQTVDKSMLFYLPLDDGIEVVRVLHGARDLERLFEKTL